MPHQVAHGYTSASGFLEELIQTPTWFADVVYFPLETEPVSVARSPVVP
jgi:hypothetical protein